MRNFMIPAVAVLLALTAPLQTAQAQVRVDPRAIDDAAPAPKAAPKPAPAPVRPARPVAPKPPPVAAAPPPPPQPVVPAYAPVVPVIPPPIDVPVRAAPPLSPAPVVADAPGEAAKLGAAGLRVSFGVDRADLNPTVETALNALAKTLAADASVSVTAFAPAHGDDQSAPRRLSLARAMAVRSVLLHAGIASPRVILRAQGGVPGAAGDGPVDRADIVPVATAKQSP